MICEMQIENSGKKVFCFCLIGTVSSITKARHATAFDRVNKIVDQNYTWEALLWGYGRPYKQKTKDLESKIFSKPDFLLFSKWWWWVILDLDHVANVTHISAKKIINKKTTWPLKRIFQVLQNLTKQEFLALFV